MNFEDALLLAIIDKLLIGLVLLIAGLWLNTRLERLKGQISLHNALAQHRAAALGALWNLTQPLTPRNVDPEPTVCKSSFNDLRRWYYSESGAMHLSYEATDQSLGLLTALQATTPNCVSIKHLASKLRTQLKVDMGVYTKRQSKIKFAN